MNFHFNWIISIKLCLFYKNVRLVRFLLYFMKLKFKCHFESVHTTRLQAIKKMLQTDVNPHYPQYQTTNHLSSHQQSGTDEKPEMVINVHPISYQATSYDMLTKPKTVIYVTTHDETPKTRKYPYNLQPQAYDHQEVAAAASGPEEHLYPLTYEPHPKR